MNEPNKRYEVDPSRLESAETVDDNRSNLMELTQKVFNGIISSSERCVCGFSAEVWWILWI